MTDVVVRLVVAVVSLGAGGGLGLLVRTRRREVPAGPADRLAPGLHLVTAPFCSRCSSLRSRLGALGTPFAEIDVRSAHGHLDALGVRSAPTLLLVGADRRVADREHANFSLDRLRELATLTR